MPTFQPFVSLAPRQVCAKMTCCITLDSFPDDGRLRRETFRNIKCDMLYKYIRSILSILLDYYRESLIIMHGMNIKFLLSPSGNFQ
jgi:hypothetical protein